MATAAKAKQYKAKKFRVAVEGATTDGRIIERPWIEQMAANYDAKKYGARINIEHIKGYHPDSTFRAMGDVISLSTEEFQDGDKTKLALVAELSPTEELIGFIDKRQKVYTSIEVNPKFADTGEAYLMGIAVTDTPASLGTEMLQFSSTATANPLANRKTTEHCLFTAAELTALTFEKEEESLSDKIKGLFSKAKEATTEATSQFRGEVEEALTTLATEVAGYKAEQKIHAQSYKALSDAHDALKQEFATLKTKLESETNQFTHTPATGGNDQTHQTDC